MEDQAFKSLASLNFVETMLKSQRLSIRQKFPFALSCECYITFLQLRPLFVKEARIDFLFLTKNLLKCILMIFPVTNTCVFQVM